MFLSGTFRVKKVIEIMSSYTAGTSFVKSADKNTKWYIIDAADVVLGRLASEIAKMLRGKHKPQYTPHNDACSDKIIVVNAEKVKLTGNSKKDNMLFQWHTGYPGGLKQRTCQRNHYGQIPYEITFQRSQKNDAQRKPPCQTTTKRPLLIRGKGASSYCPVSRSIGSWGKKSKKQKK